MSDCFIVNLSHTHRQDRYITLWRPDDKGYAWPLSWAGRYPRELVMENLHYYNTGTANIAVPCEVVEALAVDPLPGTVDGNAGPVVPSTRANWQLLIAAVVATPPYRPTPEYPRRPRLPGLQLTEEQTRILRHMLGIDKPDERDPKAYRDYYCANPGDPELHALAGLRMVEIYSREGRYEWFRTTAAGRAAAIASHRTILEPKAKRVYSRYLDVKDALGDLTFREFLTHPQFAETRRAA
jgi:hypothetical protein